MTPCRGRLFGLDCSEQAQAERRAQLVALMAKVRSGVTSIADRGRSVSYQNFATLGPILRNLRNEIDACELGYWPRGRRISYIDLIKGL